MCGSRLKRRLPAAPLVEVEPCPEQDVLARLRRLAPAQDQRDLLLLLDGHSVAYRAFFALPIENFSTTTGQPTNAVYGFIRVLLKLLRERKPDYWAVVLDPPGPVFRNEQFAEYKAHRKPMPDDMKPQTGRLQQVLAAMDVPVFMVDVPTKELDEARAAAPRAKIVDHSELANAIKSTVSAPM